MFPIDFEVKCQGQTAGLCTNVDRPTSFAIKLPIFKLVQWMSRGEDDPYGFSGYMVKGQGQTTCLWKNFRSTSLIPSQESS